MQGIAVYIPSFNDSDFVRESLSSVPPAWKVVISDNASDEPHATALGALASERVRVVRQPKNIGRVRNWKFCVEHFLESGQTWMKFITAGDVLRPSISVIYEKALQTAPACQLLVGQVEMVYPQSSITWSQSEKYMISSPISAMTGMSRGGNIFHSLSAVLFHVDTVRDGFSFSEDTLSFCADLWFLMNIARKTHTVFIPETIVEFVAARRRHFQKGIYSLEHLMEEGLLRLRAADATLELGCDRATRNELVTIIVDWLGQMDLQSISKLTGDTLYRPEDYEA